MYDDRWVLEPNGCHRWIGATAGSGVRQPYVRIFGKAHYVCRLVCEQIYGPPPTPEHEVAHDTPNGCIGSMCINGEHIRWATRSENNMDKPHHVRHAVVGSKATPPPAIMTQVAKAVREAQMPREGDELVEIEVKIEYTTAKARLVIDTMSGNQAWLPISISSIAREMDPDGNTLMMAPMWWLRKNRFIE